MWPVSGGLMVMVLTQHVRYLWFEFQSLHKSSGNLLGPGGTIHKVMTMTINYLIYHVYRSLDDVVQLAREAWWSKWLGCLPSL